MESFEEMKMRYQNDLLRYAHLSGAGTSEPEPVLPRPAESTEREPLEKETVSGENVVSDRMEEDNGTASLIVRTFTAREALPLEGALVIVSRYIGSDPTLQWMGLTDISGNTPRILLPAPDKGLSERPGEERPYAAYIVQAVKEGYYTAEFRNVPVFAGVSAVQPVEMIPLPGQPGIGPQTIVVERAPDL